MNEAKEKKTIKVNKFYYTFIYKQPCKAHLCLNKNIQYILLLKKTAFSVEIYINTSLSSDRRENKGPKLQMFSQHEN